MLLIPTHECVYEISDTVDDQLIMIKFFLKVTVFKLSYGKDVAVGRK